MFSSIRFKPLLLGLGPVFVSICLFFPGGSSFSWLLNGAIVFCVLCIQIATHFFNDAEDFLKGADSPSRKGPQRGVQKKLVSPSQLRKAGFVSLCLAGLAGLYIVAQGGWLLFFLGCISLMLAYFYTGGPYSLSYTGTADVFVLLFFGLIPCLFVFYLNTGDWSGDSVVAGLQCGFLALSLLVLNNLRDREEDRQAGKKTLVVRWGAQWGKREWMGAHYLPYVLGIYWFFQSHPWAGGGPLLLLPFSLYMQGLLRKTFHQESFYGKLFSCILWHYFLFVCFLCLSLRRFGA